jgi:hypothetical protein
MPKTARHILATLSLLLLSVSLTSAQSSSTRAAPPGDNLISAIGVLLDVSGQLPTSFVVNNMHEATLQTGELPPSCGPNNVNGSVWYTFNAAAGRLTIDTAGSDFDSLITLYRAPAITFPPYVDEIACSDSGPAASIQARLRLDVPTGFYLVRVDNNDVTDPSPALLNVSFLLEPDVAPLTVAGDNLASASKVKFGKRVTIDNVAYATKEPGELMPGCLSAPVGHTVWQTFDLQFAGNLNANLYGTTLTNIQNGFFLGSYAIALYREDPPGTLTEVECVSYSSPVQRVGIEDLGITPGTYYIQISSSANVNLVNPSTYRMSAGIDIPTTVLQSGNFDGDNSKWKVGGSSGSAIEAEPLGSSLDGNVFACRNLGTGKASLSQKIKFGDLAFSKDLYVRVPIAMAASVQDVYTIDFKLTSKYANGTSSSEKQSLHIYVGPATTTAADFYPKRGKIISLKLKITCQPPQGQSLYIDNLSLSIRSTTPYREDADNNVLPLPAF